VRKAPGRVCNGGRDGARLGRNMARGSTVPAPPAAKDKIALHCDAVRQIPTIEFRIFRHSFRIFSLRQTPPSKLRRARTLRLDQYCKPLVKTSSRIPSRIWRRVRGLTLLPTSALIANRGAISRNEVHSETPVRPQSTQNAELISLLLTDVQIRSMFCCVISKKPR